MQAKVSLKLVDEVIKSWGADPAFLIPMMQDLQAQYNYLPRPALSRLQEKLNIPLVRVSEVATFYKTFSLKPKGKYIIQVCTGTACHLRGAPRIADSFMRELGIEVNGTTKDGKFTLSTVNCLGACALAPVVKVNEDVHGQVSSDKVKKIIEAYAARKKR